MKLKGMYTDAGRILAAQAQAAEAGLTITRAAAGSLLTEKNQTAMAREDQSLTLHGKTAVEGVCTVEAVLSASAAGQDYLLREVGLFAKLAGGTEQLYKLFRLDEPITIEAGTDLTVNLYLSETILQEDRLQVVVSQQGLVTQEVCQQIAQAASGPVEQALSSHTGDASAHSALFAAKAASVHTHPASKITGGRLGGRVTADINTYYTTAQLRDIVLSADEPSGGTNGMVWIQYVT